MLGSSYVALVLGVFFGVTQTPSLWFLGFPIIRVCIGSFLLLCCPSFKDVHCILLILRIHLGRWEIFIILARAEIVF
jgi:hypothetical protein